MILDEGLEPGTALRIDTIAKDWGVSQTPLREALAELENTGLVVCVPRRLPVPEYPSPPVRRVPRHPGSSIKG